MLNPYDKCVANKMINGKQCTISWYVDDNKLSHIETTVVDQILGVIKKHFGELTTSRGNEHSFLGMNIKFDKEKQTVAINMKGQLQEAIDLYPDKIPDRVVSPASKHLFDVNDDAEQLEMERSKVFHSIVMKLMYIMKRTRPDLEPTIAFLSTRVTKSDVDDWKKLGCVLSYIKCTINDDRIIGATSLEELWNWIDSSHAVHQNMRGQTGGAMSLGVGTLHCRSTKQRINSRSSTETEVIGVSEYLPYNVWLLLFLKAQGYDLMSNVLFQDNQSTIRIERNGRNSCTGNSRHIDVRYFWVKDVVDRKEIKIEYCPTKQMLADYFTKPLNGRLFKYFRDIIMGYIPIRELIEKTRSKMKERVENND